MQTSLNLFREPPMKLSLQNLSSLFPKQVWLGYSDTLYEQLLSTAHQSCSNETACQTAVLNGLCLTVLTDWMQNHQDDSHRPSVWPSETDLHSIWELVNGTALWVGETRLILIPSDALDTESFAVPQEWVDIPSWVGDYYLPIQVNQEDGWVCVWGYATYQDLKKKGTYDPIYHTYSLERDWVTSDLDLLWVRNEIKISEPSVTPSFPSLSPFRIESLIQTLSEPSPYSPRLDQGFEEWAALIEQPHLRQRLYRQRLQNASAPPQNQVQTSIINTGLWLQGKVDQLAQELSWVLLPTLSLEASPLRSPTQEITSIINQLQQSRLTIPDTSCGAYQDIQLADVALRLYAITWPFAAIDSTPQWYLLLLLSEQRGAGLPSGIKLSVSDEICVLVEQTLAEMGHQQYVVAGVSGTWNETFQASITLKNDASLTLPAFGFRPEPSL
jgi:hypothetical protein